MIRTFVCVLLLLLISEAGWSRRKPARVVDRVEPKIGNSQTHEQISESELGVPEMPAEAAPASPGAPEVETSPKPEAVSDGVPPAVIPGTSESVENNPDVEIKVESEVDPDSDPSRSELSQYFWMAPKGISALNLIWSYSFSKYNLEGAVVTEQVDGKGMGLSLVYERGIHAMWSLGLNLSYSIHQADYLPYSLRSEKKNGFHDILLFAKNRRELSGWNFYYGFLLGLSLEKNRTPTTSQAGNNFSGGARLGAHMGGEVPFGKVNFVGARVDLVIPFERTVQGDPEERYRGGQIAQVMFFYENQTAPVFFNFALGARNVGESEPSSGAARLSQKNSILGLLRFGHFMSERSQLTFEYQAESVRDCEAGFVGSGTLEKAHVDHVFTLGSRVEF